MKKILCTIGLLLAAAPAAASGPTDTSINYQGELRRAGEALSDTCDFQFRLFDAAPTVLSSAPRSPSTRSRSRTDA